MDMQWLPVFSRRLDHRFGWDCDACQQVLFFSSGCSLLAAAAPSPVGAHGTGATTSAIILARQRRSKWHRRGLAPLFLSGSRRSAGHAAGLRHRRLAHQRYGPQSGRQHHNPTPGPAGSPFLYGHVWVCLARLVRHRSGERSPCRSSRTVHPGQRYRLDGGLLRLAVPHQWSWPPPRSSGWSSSWARHPPIWVDRRGFVKRPFLKRVLVR